MKHKAQLSQSAAVRYRVSVIENGRTVKRKPWKRNLILDQGLDSIAVRTWPEAFSHAVVGTGTDPTKRDSGAITFSRAGTTVTASASFFEAQDAGRLLKFDTGEEMYIATFTSGTAVEVDTSGALAASEGTVWYVNQAALTTETKRTATYGTNGGDNASTWELGSLWRMKRTFIFSAEAGSINYREIGWSHTATLGANLFGRDLLAGGGVNLVAGQQLKVEVELTVTLSPVSATAYTNVITGWTQDGQSCIEDSRMWKVASTGALDSLGGDNLRPSAVSFPWSLSTSSAVLRNADPSNQDLSPSTHATITLTGQAYISGTFQRTFTGTFAVGAGNRSDWRSMGIGQDGGGGQFRTQFRILLAATETKDSDHTLAIEFTWSWGRTLTN